MRASGVALPMSVSLSKDVCPQHVVTTIKCIQRLEEPYRVARNQPRPLVD
jgi:hypothetical protein